MNILKKQSFLFILFLFFSLSILKAQDFTVTKNPDAMFWTIDGTDTNGNPSRIYVLGTFHLADKDIFPIPEFILDAWNQSDRICGELSLEDWNNIYPTTLQLISNSIIKDSNNRVENFLSENEIQILKNAFGKKYKVFLMYEPWLISNMVNSISLESTTLDNKYSYDLFFMNKAANENIAITGLDDLQTQMNLIRFGTFEEQLLMLKENIKDFSNSQNSEEIEQTYKLYKSADENEFAKYFFAQIENDCKAGDVYKKYYNAMLEERNIKWGKTFAQYLDNGGTTFVFAGVGHFIGKDSVFTFIKSSRFDCNDDEEFENAIKEETTEEYNEELNKEFTEEIENKIEENPIDKNEDYSLDRFDDNDFEVLE